MGLLAWAQWQCFGLPYRCCCTCREREGNWQAGNAQYMQAHGSIPHAMPSEATRAVQATPGATSRPASAALSNNSRFIESTRQNHAVLAQAAQNDTAGASSRLQAMVRCPCQLQGVVAQKGGSELTSSALSADLAHILHAEAYQYEPFTCMWISGELTGSGATQQHRQSPALSSAKPSPSAHPCR